MFPPAAVYYTHNGYAINRISTNSTLLTVGASMVSLTTADSGTYVCNAEGSSGEADEKSIELTVECGKLQQALPYTIYNFICQN